MYRFYNPNPSGSLTEEDCVLRALSYALNTTWDKVFLELSMECFNKKCIRMDRNDIWGSYLYNKGFRQHLVYDICPDCYTVADFCRQHPRGLFVLATGIHVLAVNDGIYYDSWDSGQEHPIFYWQKEIDDGD